MEKLKELFNDPTINRVFFLVIGLIIIWLIIRLIKRSIVSRIKDNDSHYKANKVSGFLGFFLALILVLITFSDKLGGFTVALGIAGAGIAFALQEVIVSFAGYLSIIIGGLYKSGDRIQLGGIKGDVMDIGVFKTTIMETGQWVSGDLYNGRIVVIANSFVFKEPVFNYSGEFPFLWDEVKIPIQFGSNYDKAKEIILNAGVKFDDKISDTSNKKWNSLKNKYRLEDAQTSPMVSVEINDNWVEYTLRFIVNYKKRRGTKTAIFMDILKQVEESKGEVKFASSTFQLVDTPEFKVKITE